MPEDYEKDYDEFWKSIVEKDGQLNLDQLKRELFDYHNLMSNAAKVYCEVTGSRVSKVNTLPEGVISAFEDHMEELIDQAVEDRKEESEESE